METNCVFTVQKSKKAIVIILHIYFFKLIFTVIFFFSKLNFHISTGNSKGNH